MATFQKVKFGYQKKMLGEVVDFIDGDRGANYPSQGEFFPSGDCLFLSTKNVPNSKFSFEEKSFILAEKDAILRKGKLKRGDYVLTTRGTVGNFAYYDNNVPYKNIRINSGMVILRKKSDELDESFFRYYLASSSFSGQVNGRVSGSAQPQLPIRDMLTMNIDLPDLQTQSLIAAVLSAYDDLIENNEKRIKALEEMAQLLYTEWFVKFKFPGHEKAKMVDSGSEYGMIPEGWQIVPMGAMASFLNGYPFKPKDLGDSGLPIIKIPELRSGILEKTPRNTGTSIPEKYRIKDGDIIFSWSATLLVNIWNSGHALLNQHLFLVSPKLDIYRSFVFYALTRLVEKLSKHAVGATMQHLRRDTIVDAKMILPTENVLERYENLAANFLDQIAILQKENQNLCKMRDLLIPQLVSGKRILTTQP